MSVTRIVSIHCDGCGEWASSDAICSEGTASAIRRMLRRGGWTSLPGGRDYCPDCTKGSAS